MAVDGTPRSVADATRFTSNTPHANAKARQPTPNTSASSASPSSSTRNIPGSSSRAPPASSSSARSSGAAPLRRPPPAGSAAAGAPGGGHRPETLDEKVRRLRAAHLAARNHEMSRMDKIIGSSRRYMDAAHRFTVLGLIGFSGLALFVTVYATADMMIYNRKRRNEFFAVQKKLEADSLEAARLAYMSGKATEHQIALVEEATDRAKKEGTSMPALLSTPQPVAAAGGAVATTERTIWPGEAMQESSLGGAVDEQQPQQQQKKGGLTGWLFGGLKKEDEAAGSESGFIKEEVAASGRSRTSAAVSTLNEQKNMLNDKAKAAVETERQNQRNGGPLDQVGLKAGEKRKEGWFW